MKKLLLLATFVGISGLVHATTINAPSSLTGFQSLDGADAYSWGISIAVPVGQQVATAEIDFSSVTLNVANSSGKGVLYTDLLKSKNTGVNTVSDGDAAGDYWVGHSSPSAITALSTQTFASVGTTHSWNVVFTSDEITALNSYLTANNGVFDIGLDPDCHFSVGSIKFVYTLTPGHNTVPDVATTAFLLVLGLVGLEVFRRQFAAAKAKA